MDKEVLTIVSTVAATLKQFSWYTNGLLNFDEIAREVELNWDGVCCPLCEEVTCDEGCPLESVREGL
ncbi:hypothetical protein RGQ21_67610 [Kitasatospora aureofaciens]|nr:hypothetical protein RGQ21_67610 [Kitasatospora aureofaciens]